MKNQAKEYRQFINSLQIAKKILLCGAFVQILFFLPRLFPGIGQRLFVSITVFSAILGGIGFIIVYRQLELKREALEESSTRHFIGQTAMGTTVMFFIAAFFLPFINLIIFCWTYVRANSAIRDLEAIRSEELRKEKIRDKLRSGVAKI